MLFLSSTWVHLRFLIGFVLLITLVFCVVLFLSALFVLVLCAQCLWIVQLLLLFRLCNTTLIICPSIIKTTIMNVTRMGIQRMSLYSDVKNCRYIIKYVQHISGVTFIGYSPSQKTGNPNNFKRLYEQESKENA